MVLTQFQLPLILLFAPSDLIMYLHVPVLKKDYAQLRQNTKRMKHNKILVLAHLTGKASTDTIYEKVVSTTGEIR